MPLKDAFGKFVDSVEAKVGKRPPHPPIPFGSKPKIHAGQAAPVGQSNIFWSPTFHSTKSVADDFDHETGQSGWGNNELQNYTASPENSFYTSTGKLVLRAIVRSSAPSQAERYTSARLSSRQKLSRQQGCLKVRLTVPSAAGVWPAFWLLPAEPFQWPNEGEVDIVESWNGEAVNHTCLHWGHFNGEDSKKHRVVETPIPRLTHPTGMEYTFAWQQPENGTGGRMVWYIDGKPAMKAFLPEGTRRISDWRIIINVALGGNVCQGVTPADGHYDMTIHSVTLESEPPLGWGGFEADFRKTKEGHTM